LPGSLPWRSWERGGRSSPPGALAHPPGILARVSYAPPVSGAELRSACVGATLGRPVNATEVVFLLVFSFSFFLDFWFYCFLLVFCFVFFFILFLSYNFKYFLKLNIFKNLNIFQI
jgi:hypothetical protein